MLFQSSSILKLLPLVLYAFKPIVTLFTGKLCKLIKVIEPVAELLPNLIESLFLKTLVKVVAISTFFLNTLRNDKISAILQQTILIINIVLFIISLIFYLIF